MRYSRITPHQCKLGGMIRSSNFQFKFSVYALTPCIAVLCLSHPSCCQRADACRFERLVECASEGHAWGSHGSLVSDPACEQLAGCTVPRHARDVAGPAKKTGAVIVVERLQSNASVQRVFDIAISKVILRTMSILLNYFGSWFHFHIQYYIHIYTHKYIFINKLYNIKK